MRKWKGVARSCTLLALLNVLLSSCTRVGAGVGAGIDSLIPGPYQEPPATELVRLERNQRIVFILRNGRRVSGRYLGTHGPTAADLDQYLMVDASESLV